MVSDGRGLPLAAEISAGQSHESKSFVAVLDAIQIRQQSGQIRCRPGRLAGDKGYSYRWIREWLRARKIEPVIPERSNQHGRIGGCRRFDSEAYRRRNVVERAIGLLKECRRVATRFEKLAVNYLAMLKLAILRIYLKTLISDRP